MDMTKLFTIPRLLGVVAVFCAIGLLRLCGIVTFITIAHILLEWLGYFPWKVIAVNLCVFLPLGFFKKTKKFAGLAMIISAIFLCLTLWLEGSLVVYYTWGILPVKISLCLSGIGVIPAAILATLFDWNLAELFGLIIFLISTLAMGFFGYYRYKQTID